MGDFDLLTLQDETLQQAWAAKAYKCKVSATGKHSWIVIGKTHTPASETVTMLMCGECFHELNISDAFRWRD